MLWVRLPSEPFTSRPRGAVRSARHPVTVEIVGSNPIEDACLRRGTQSGKAAKLKTSWFVGSTPTRVTKTHASAGHWRAQVAVTHPPSGFGGSTPSRRTRTMTARSSSGSGIRPLKPATRVQIPHGSLTRPSGATGRHATLRTSCPHGLGSSTLPLVTRNFGRPVIQDRSTTRARAAARMDRPWRCRRGRCPTGFHKAGMPGSIPGPATDCVHGQPAG